MFFYRLGHVPALSLAELSLHHLEYSILDSHFVSSLHDLNIQNMGSIAWKAETIEDGDFLEAVCKYLTKTEKRKKFVGIALPNGANSTKYIKKLKEAGAKKIAFLQGQPTIGDWKRNNMIFVSHAFEDVLYNMLILDYFDQDKWAKLENALPATDMKRGQINLKLARTLRNFTTSKSLFDPFCGIGRNAVACLDTIEEILLSDKDPQAISDSRKNCAFAQERLGTNVNMSFFIADAKTFSPSAPTETTIVSEGWLGTNTQLHPTLQASESSAQEVLKLYQQCFTHWNTIGIPEIILCAPFYPSFATLTRAIENSIIQIVEESGYSLKQLVTSPFIHYARPQSYVGHLIFKAVTKQK